MSLINIEEKFYENKKGFQKPISVFSEIDFLNTVLVHSPKREIEFIDPKKLKELLFSAVLEPKSTRKEHKKFVDILKKEGVNVVELVDFVAETFAHSTPLIRKQFIDLFIAESKPKIASKNKQLVFDFLINQKTPQKMVEFMMSGILSSDLKLSDSDIHLITNPMPNLTFTRDPFSSVGNGIILSSMKYEIRQRETLFSRFIFQNHPVWKKTTIYFGNLNGNSLKDLPIEGGDIFVYNKETLVIGVSERTKYETVIYLAEILKKDATNTFKRIVAINVPPMPNLMHLDTWLTMLDHNKFLYSPNMLSCQKIWDIDLTVSGEIQPKILNVDLKTLLKSIIKVDPILIPVGGEDANYLDINVETHFDATNYLVIRPGVVVGYDRNHKTTAALQKAGIVVHSFKGNQLSLAMGGARCMSMPLVRSKK